MRIDVPEKQLAAQWRLGSAYRALVAEASRRRLLRQHLTPFFYDWGFLALGLETSTNIRALDLLGCSMSPEAVNYWLFAAKHATPWGKFAELGTGR